MPYKVTNLVNSRRDPNKRNRGRRGPDIRRAAVRFKIGGRRLQIGKSIIINDSFYAAHKSVIDTYALEGLIALQATGGTAEVESQIPLHAPSPEPPVPTSPPEDSKDTGGPIVIEMAPESDESDEGAVILEAAPEEAPEEAPEKPAKKKASSKKTEEKKEEPKKRSSRRSRRKSEDE